MTNLKQLMLAAMLVPVCSALVANVEKVKEEEEKPVATELCGADNCTHGDKDREEKEQN